MVNFIASQFHVHWVDCEECQDADVYEDKYLRCEYGARMHDNWLKWKRRCKYAARREGVKITV